MPQVISICVLLEKKGDYNMLEVYISDKTLEKICLESPDSSLGKILSKQSVIYISEENPDQLLDETGVLWQIEMAGVHLEPSTAFIQDVISGSKSISEKPFGVFILDIEPQKALKMQRENGVICMSSDKIDDDILTLIDPCTKVYAEGEKGKWSEVLVGVKSGSFVSNSIIINDRNLFANDRQLTNSHTGEKYDDTAGIDNIAAILDEIIPNELGVPYHVAILCDYECVKTTNGLTHKSVSEKINKIKKKLNRTFPIEIEIVFIKDGDNRITAPTHNRRIISNYFILRADHKICAFKSGISLCGQNVSIDKLYSRGLFDKSDPPAKDHKMSVMQYRLIRQFLLEYEGRGIGSTYYTFRQNGQEKTITELKNRLLI